ncbi:MAG: TadE/TadG family type IV pilus assembly protein [Acidimicrobiia bacterium]
MAEIGGAGSEVGVTTRSVSSRHEAGASLLEFALVLPILAALLLGTVTAALAFSNSLSLNNAARETARFGATLPVDPDMGTWLNQVVDVAISSATGDLDNGVPGREVCVAYVHPNGGSADDSTTMLTLDDIGNRDIVADGTTCFPDGRPDDERRVQVRLVRDADLNVLFFTNTISLTRDSTIRFERVP